MEQESSWRNYEFVRASFVSQDPRWTLTHDEPMALVLARPMQERGTHLLTASLILTGCLLLLYEVRSTKCSIRLAPPIKPEVGHILAFHVASLLQLCR